MCGRVPERACNGKIAVLSDGERCKASAPPSSRPCPDLYLYGSVPRAMAQPGKSDLDLTLVLSRPLSTPEAESLERVRSNLEAGHPEVTKIDLDLGVLEDVLNPANLHSWGYWLKHECRCIHGSDLALRFQAFQPSPAVAKAVNGDYVQVLRDYMTRISQAHDEDATRRLKKRLQKAGSRNQRSAP